MKLVIEISEKDFNNIEPFLNGETIKGGFNLFNVLRIIKNGTPVKVGHWIGIDEEPHEDYECDICGYTISTYTANIKPHTEYKYCPNCGARMESEDKE